MANMPPSGPREPHTIEQVADAVIPVLAALSGGHVDPADARHIASLVVPAVNSPASTIARGSNLVLNSEFIRLVAEKKGAANLAGSDGMFARKQTMDALKHANITSAEFAAALGKAGFPGPALWATKHAQSAEGGGNAGQSSSASYGRELPGSNSVIGKALASEGFSERQIAGAFLTGQVLGWGDKESMRILAGAGTEAQAIAVRYHDAVKHGDHQAAADALQDLERILRDPKTPESQKNYIRKLIPKLKEEQQKEQVLDKNIPVEKKKVMVEKKEAVLDNKAAATKDTRANLKEEKARTVEEKVRKVDAEAAAMFGDEAPKADKAPKPKTEKDKVQKPGDPAPQRHARQLRTAPPQHHV